MSDTLIIVLGFLATMLVFAFLYRNGKISFGFKAPGVEANAEASNPEPKASQPASIDVPGNPEQKSEGSGSTIHAEGERSVAVKDASGAVINTGDNATIGKT